MTHLDINIPDPQIMNDCVFLSEDSIFSKISKTIPSAVYGAAFK